MARQPWPPPGTELDGDVQRPAFVGARLGQPPPHPENNPNMRRRRRSWPTAGARNHSRRRNGA
eukprot:5153245-Lingulodinium_polyedra.AAC.1